MGLKGQKGIKPGCLYSQDVKGGPPWSKKGVKGGRPPYGAKRMLKVPPPPPPLEQEEC